MSGKWMRTLAVATVLLLAAAAPTLAFTPARVTCIAPANPGGGWDFSCRSGARALFDLGFTSKPIKVVNMPGGGGGVAFAHVVTELKGDNNVLVAASRSTTTRLAQGQYTKFTMNDVRWLAANGADYGVISVKADAPWQNLKELMAAWKKDPGKIAVGGGSAVGGQDHMKVMLLAKAAGIEPKKIKYVNFNGGGEAMVSLLGGFVQVFPGDISEVMGQLEAGKGRVLAVLGESRLPGNLANIPTAVEQGYNATWVVWMGFYMPPGTSDDAYNYWLNALTKMEKSDEWAKMRKQNGLAPFYRGGKDFEKFVKDQIHEIQGLTKELGL